MRRSLVACIPPLLLITCLVMLPGLEDKKNPSVFFIFISPPLKEVLHLQEIGWQF